MRRPAPVLLLAALLVACGGGKRGKTTPATHPVSGPAKADPFAIPCRKDLPPAPDLVPPDAEEAYPAGPTEVTPRAVADACAKAADAAKAAANKAGKKVKVDDAAAMLLEGYSTCTSAGEAKGAWRFELRDLVATAGGDASPPLLVGTWTLLYLPAKGKPIVTDRTGTIRSDGETASGPGVDWAADIDKDGTVELRVGARDTGPAGDVYTDEVTLTVKDGKVVPFAALDAFRPSSPRDVDQDGVADFLVSGIYALPTADVHELGDPPFLLRHGKADGSYVGDDDIAIEYVSAQCSVAHPTPPFLTNDDGSKVTPADVGLAASCARFRGVPAAAVEADLRSECAAVGTDGAFAGLPCDALATSFAAEPPFKILVRCDAEDAGAGDGAAH